MFLVYPSAGVVDVSHCIHHVGTPYRSLSISSVTHMSHLNHLLFISGVICDHSFVSLVTASFRAKFI